MACLVRRNKKKEVIQVKLEQGGNSILFDKLVKNVHLSNEEAYIAYTNIHSKNFKDEFGDWEAKPVLKEGEIPVFSNVITYETGEPRLFYLTPKGEIVEDYAEALKGVPSGNIKAGFIKTDDVFEPKDKALFEASNNDFVAYNSSYKLNNTEAFLEVAELDSNTNPETKAGFINYGISQGWLASSKVLNRFGEFVHKVAGALTETWVLNRRALINYVNKNQLRDYVKIGLQDEVEISEFEQVYYKLDSKGNIVETTEQEFLTDYNKLSLEALVQKYPNFYAYYSLQMAKEQGYGDSNETIAVETEEGVNKRLEHQLLDVLGKLGFSVVSLDAYRKAHKLKYGEDVTPEGLVDIANKVIALSKGASNLTFVEEVSHLFIEAYHDRGEIAEILPLVENTAIWKELSGKYFEVYGEAYKGDELIEKVRMEILGKLLSQKIVDKFATEKGNETLVTRLKNIFNSMLAKIKSLFVPSISRNIESITDKLAEKVLNKDFEKFVNAEYFTFNDSVYYDTKDKKNLIELDNAISVLTNKEMRQKKGQSSLLYSTREAIGYLQELKREDIEELEAIAAIKGFLSSINSDINYFKKQLKGFEENNNPCDILDLDIREMGGELLNLVVKITQLVQDDFETSILIEDEHGNITESLKSDLINDLKNTIFRINTLNNLYKEKSRQRAERMYASNKETVLGKSVNENFVKDEEFSEDFLLEAVKKFMESKGRLDTEYITWEDFMTNEPELAREFIQANPLLYKQYLNAKKVVNFMDQTKEMKKDISSFSRLFGLKSMMSNWYLRQMFKKFQLMFVNIAAQSQKQLNPTLVKIQDVMGKIPSITNNRLLRQKREDGTFSDYLISAIDNGKFEEKKIKIFLETFNSIFGTKYDNYSLLREHLNKGALEPLIRKTNENTSLINRLIKEHHLEDEHAIESLALHTLITEKKFKEWRRTYLDDRKYKPAFYEEIQLLNEKLKVSETTLNHLQELSRLKRLYNENKSRLSLQRIREKRRQLSSLYKGGEKKIGLDLRIAQEIQRKDKFFALLVQKYANDSELADALNKFNEESFEDVADYLSLDFVKARLKTFTVKEAFYEAMEEVPLEERGGFITDNIIVHLNDKFWGERNQSLIDSLREELELQRDTLPDAEEMEALIVALEDKLQHRRSLLKIYQKFSSPLEINYDSVKANNDVKVIKILDISIHNLMDRLAPLRSDSQFQEEEVLGETVPTEDYEVALKESGLNEISFLREHCQNPRRYADFGSILGTGVTEIAPRFRHFYLALYRREHNITSTTEEITDYELLDFFQTYERMALVIEYGKTQLHSYFKKFVPKGYEQFMAEVKEGRYSPKDLVDKNIDNDILEYLDFAPDYRWQEDISQDKWLNPNYKEDWNGKGFVMPKEINQQFLEFFGINEKAFRELGYIEPPMLSEIESELDEGKRAEMQALRDRYLSLVTQNQNYFLYREQLLGMMDGIKHLTNQQAHNRYHIPQISKRGFERLQDLGDSKSKNAIKRFIDDLLYIRRDTLERGSEMNRANNKFIPLLYFNKLEESSDVSEDFVSSYALMYQEALRYQERHKMKEDLFALRNDMLGQEIFKDGTKIEGSRVMRKFDEEMDAYLYGIKYNKSREVKIGNKTVDYGHLLFSLNRYIGGINSKYNPYFSTTGLMAGRVSRLVENVVGEYMDKGTILRGNAIAIENLTEYVSELGKVNKTSDNYVLKELFGLKHHSERVKSAAFARGLRALDNAAYQIYEVTGYMVDEPTLYQILLDTKIVNGVPFTKRQYFRRFVLSEGRTKEKLQAEWDALPSLYAGKDNSSNILSINKETGVVEFKGDFTEAQKQEIIANVYGRVTDLLSNINGQLDVANIPTANRHYILTYLMTHRAWALKAYYRRFKSRIYNEATGEIEEGTYTTLFNYLNHGVLHSLLSMREKSMVEAIQDMKDEYRNLTEEEKKNMLRAGVEITTAMLLGALGAMAMGIMNADGDDDKDDTWAVQFLCYNFLRTVSEIGSTQLPTGLLDAVNLLESPMIAANNIKEIFSLAFNEPLTEIEGSSAFAGHTRLYKALINQTSLKQLYGLKRINQKANYFYRKNIGSMLYTRKTRDWFFPDEVGKKKKDKKKKKTILK